MKFLRIQWFKKILGAAERSASRFLFFGAIGALFFGLLWMIAHPYFGVRYDYRLGEISQENVVTPRDITYVNEKETAKRIQEMKERVPPIFEMRIAAGKQIGTMNQFFSRLQTTSAEQLLAESEGQDGAVSLSLEKLQFLADSEKTAEYRLVMESLVDALSEKGYTRMEREELDNFTGTGMIVEKIRESEITEETIQPEEVIAGGELETAATSYLKRNHPQLDESERRALASAAPLFISPNLFYDEEESRQYLAEQIKKVEPVYNTLKKGAIVIRTGEEINETSFRKLEAISQHTSYFNLQAVLGISIILGILLTLSLIIFLEEQDRKSANNYLVFAMFILVSVAYAYLMNLIRNVPDYLVFGVFIPAAGITMTAELLYKRKFSLTLALVLPILFMLISGNDAYTFLFTLGSGLIGIFTVRNAEKRGDLLRSSLVLVITNCLILGAAGLLRELAPRQFVMLLVWGAGNGVVSVILTLGVTPFFEIILNLPTNFRLLELSDLNTPVLKKMQIEAPGTYHHSLNVANMAENAARAIKANSLLVRVAALYHDVGKIPNSEYFIENSGGESKHDSLKPSLSNSILKAHVKMGVEMSRQMKLPDEVVDIIAQHHGTSLMKYFYNQALEKYDNGDIDKKDYHYPGPKPQNREAAIVLLADNVEAASRVLKKPSPTRIEEFVNEVVESKFREGQLNESTLTLRGLMKISIAFRRYLMGVFHTRIQYPDDRELEGKEQDKKQKEVKK
jgi:hypothetical protein